MSATQERASDTTAGARAERSVPDPKRFVTELHRHVRVLDSRGAATSALRCIDDVLLAWDNWAILAPDEVGKDRSDILVPSISVLAEPPFLVAGGHLAHAEEKAPGGAEKGDVPAGAIRTGSERIAAAAVRPTPVAARPR